MNWIAITADDLRDRKVAALVTAFRTAALGSGQGDPTETIIADVVFRVRAEVASCPRNSLDADETKIPRDLKGLAQRMVLREMQSRLQIALREDEREEQRVDLRYLERIAKCEVAVAVADSPIAGEVQAGAAVQLVASRTRVASKGGLAGL